MIDFEQARETMVESQLRTAGILDLALLSAMAAVPREKFVAPENRPLAYMDGALPIGFGKEPRYLMPPMTLGRLLQSAEIVSEDRVLVIGCGTGYSVAVIAKLGASVVGLECDPVLADAAKSNIADLDLANVAIETGPLRAGVPAQGPFDVILLDGSVPARPDELTEQLKEGGRAVGILAQGSQGTAYRFVKADGTLAGLPQFAAGAMPLPGMERAPAFEF